jgi:hypothetical protein
VSEEQTETEVLTAQQRSEAKIFFESDRACHECGGMHSRSCPRVKRHRTVYNPNGSVTEREVEYWEPGSWEHLGVVWPEDIYEED